MVKEYLFPSDCFPSTAAPRLRTLEEALTAVRTGQQISLGKFQVTCEAESLFYCGDSSFTFRRDIHLRWGEIIDPSVFAQVDGPGAPYRQSERGELYVKIAKRLVEMVRQIFLARNCCVMLSSSNFICPPCSSGLAARNLATVCDSLSALFISIIFQRQMHGAFRPSDRQPHEQFCC